MEDYSVPGRRHIKRDYYNKTFSNPYFNKKAKSGHRFNTKLYIQALTAVFLLYLIIYSDLFKVKSVEVQGADMINPEEIRSMAWADINRLKMLVFPGRNLIFINSNRISQEISAKYSLNKIEVEKGWQKISITIEEKAAYLIAYNDKAYYFIDASGTVTKELTAEDLAEYRNKFPILSLNQDLKVNNQPISGRFINYVLELNDAFKANNIRVRGFESGEVDQATVLTEAGWKALFNINMPLSRSVENMMLVLNKKLAGKKFDYIDLRFGDRVSFFPEK